MRKQASPTTPETECQFIMPYVICATEDNSPSAINSFSSTFAVADLCSKNEQDRKCPY